MSDFLFGVKVGLAGMFVLVVLALSVSALESEAAKLRCPAYSRAAFGTYTGATKAARRSATDFYTGEAFAPGASVDADHVVSLREAWYGGLCTATRARRQEFARYPDNLVATLSGINRAKGAKGPQEWSPASRVRACAYLRRYVSVGEKWDLSLELPAVKKQADDVCKPVENPVEKK